MTAVETTAAAIREVLDREAERCRALSEQDWGALAPILGDDLTHVHMSGRLEDKPRYIEGVKGRPRTTRRTGLTVRVYGDAAVMTGVLMNTRPGLDEDESMMVTQTWVRRPAGWQMVAYQSSRLQAPAG